ncbi:MULTISPECIES: NUDIX domain-containing protein [Streptomyces]|uniref:NUDIX domain-containing protein n=1 Tax=Streptomyces dengpaensis TaxID=2049881 RepID=A0ABM6SZD6_9ACTN|nr:MULTISPECIES: NUDIX domain-containing protein [Streptomyces]AVH59959.1 NUDIX domain-containing protein [Streptomyces dengpaensis]PIB09594.1 hypothetical protein B1C81_10635 [Streptomyces sp. HG99]
MTDTADPCELVDLVDREGRPTLQRIPRDTADDHPGLYLPIALVVVMSSITGDLLVHQRSSASDAAPGAVDHVCGAIQSGEPADVAARREAREEAGVALDVLLPVCAGVNDYGRYRHLYAGVTRAAAGDLAGEAGAEHLGYEPLTQLVGDAKAGRVFVKGFFDDLALAVRKLAANAVRGPVSWTGEARS